MTTSAAQNPNRLRFLHLSDLHFNIDNNDHLDPFADIRNQLQRDLSTLVKRIGPVDAILVGGDIANRADKIEYQRAGKWFDDLCQQVSLPAEKLFVVPGNHDVDRKIASNYSSIRDAHQKLRSCQLHQVDAEIRTYFRDQEDKNRLFKAIEEYNIFAQTYGCQFDAEKPYWEYIFPFESGIKLILRGINSTLVSNALDSDETEKSKLVVGKGQATCESKSDSIYMVMCHHPPSWLRDRSEIESIFNSRAAIQLYGHIHEFQTETGGLGKSLKIQAGAVQPDLVEMPFSPRYNLIQLDLNIDEPQTLKVQVWSRSWNPSTHQFRADFTDNGAEYVEVQLPVQVSLPTIPAPLEQPILSDTITSLEEQAKASETSEVTTLDKIRKIQYRLNKLHFPDFLEIAGSLKLITDEDERVTSGRDLKSIVFTRAAQQNLLRELWDLTSEKLASDEENPFSGSGLLRDVFSDLRIIPMHKQLQPRHMQIPTLRERQGFTHKFSQPLPQRVVPTLHMIRSPTVLTNRFMLLTRNHCLIRLPEIAVTFRVPIPPRNLSPQGSTRFDGSIPSRQCHNLLGHNT